MFYSYFCSHGLLGATPVEADAWSVDKLFGICLIPGGVFPSCASVGGRNEDDKMMVMSSPENQYYLPVQIMDRSCTYIN